MRKLNVKIRESILENDSDLKENDSDLKFIGSDDFFKDLCVNKFSVLIFESLYSFFTIRIRPTSVLFRKNIMGFFNLILSSIHL